MMSRINPAMIASGVRAPGAKTASPTSPRTTARSAYAAVPRLTSTDASSSGSFTSSASFVGLGRDRGTLTRHAVCLQNVGHLGNVPRALLEHLRDDLGDGGPRDAAVEERGDGHLVGAAQHRG